MKDIDIAKKHLQDEELALVVVKGGQVLYKSNGRGIKPLYTAYMEMKESLKGSSIADKVIGRAAAMICADAKIHELYTNLISENAMEVLEQAEITYSYGLAVPSIKNRDQSGLCPMEKLSLKAENINELLIGIDNFFEALK